MIKTSRDDLEAFLTSRRSNLVRFAYVLTGDAAASEDLVQNAIVEVFKRWRTIQPAGAEAYTRRVMIRRAWRDANSRREHPAPTKDLDRPAPAVDQDSVLDLRTAVESLSPDKRTIIVLRYWLRYTDPQIAEAVGCSVGTVKSRGHRAMADLRAVLRPEAAAEEADVGDPTGPALHRRRP